MSKNDDSTKNGKGKLDFSKFKIPSEIAYVAELPRNATGKVLKRTLKETRKENV